MRSKIIGIMGAVFNLRPEEISEDMALGHTSRWDSLSHMKLILALEEEFGVEFDVERILEMTNVTKIAEALTQKGCI